MPAEAAEPQEQLSPKERRTRKRSRSRGPAGPELSGTERHERRVADRKRKAAQRTRRRSKEKASADATKGEGTPSAASGEGSPKVRTGKVVSDKADKTITVKVEIVRRHPAYEKIVKRSQTLHAHDESNTAGAGDTVRIVECRPRSRMKRWRLVEVVERAR
ncbi:30S ribosomal protein S17 [Thermoleophilia bacterium SCSIO 60948]|nr:30S ribosomal protein S17 [Thermoleophilia bacterium SCSIO 60948]